MWLVAASMIGFFVDCLAGDPAWLPHPVRFIGCLISAFEKMYRGIFKKSPIGERMAGIAMAVSVLLVTGGTSLALLWIATKIHRWLGFAVMCVICWQILAAKCLKTEAGKVQQALEMGNLPQARCQIAMLVGRDTEGLDATQVAKAAVETVAENTSDGVVAPLFWLMLAGPVGGLLYKAVNTMDSMVGYKNERYLQFGRFAAKLDDAVNYLPARLSALFMIAAAFLLHYDGKAAWRIWRRDRRKHASPNSAQTESVCAGALHIQLAGNSSYFGKVYAKPCIGDAVRAVEAKDINRSSTLMYGTSIIALAVFSALRFVLSVL